VFQANLVSSFCSLPGGPPPSSDRAMVSPHPCRAGNSFPQGCSTSHLFLNRTPLFRPYSVVGSFAGLFGPPLLKRCLIYVGFSVLRNVFLSFSGRFRSKPKIYGPGVRRESIDMFFSLLPPKGLESAPLLRPCLRLPPPPTTISSPAALLPGLPRRRP